jgi:hypothetical protein
MGITQQRLIDQNSAALEYEAALNELFKRIRKTLILDPENPYLQSLALITLNDLTTNAAHIAAIVARESENIRLTQRKNLHRRLRNQPESPPTIPDLEFPESAIERRGRLIMESLGVKDEDKGS